MHDISKLALEGLSKYFNTLSNTGYLNMKDTNKLILLLFIEELLNNDLFSFYINSKDYKTIQDVLSDLYASTPIISYPEFAIQKSLVLDISENTFRKTDASIRLSEDAYARLVN